MRIATFNAENLDEDKNDKDRKVIKPTLVGRVAYITPKNHV